MMHLEKITEWYIVCFMTRLKRSGYAVSTCTMFLTRLLVLDNVAGEMRFYKAGKHPNSAADISHYEEIETRFFES